MPSGPGSSSPAGPGTVPDPGLRGAAPGSGGARRPGRTAVISASVGLAVVILVGVAVTLIVTSGPGPTAISPNARHLVRAALTATIDAGSFHYVSRFTSQGVTQTTVGDAGASAGRQVITIGPDTFTVLVSGASCFFQGNERQMVEQLGLPVAVASAHAGQWISLAPDDPPYQSVYVAVRTRSALNSNIAFVPHQEVGTSTRSGYHVLGIRGPMSNQIVNGQTQKAKGTAILYLTTSHPHLPVEYTENGTITVGGQSAKGKLEMTFSRWGEAVTVNAPQGAVSYSSLGAGNGTPPTTGPPVLTSAR